MGSSASPTTPIWKKWSITQMLAKPASSAVLAISASFGPIEAGASGQVKRGTCNPMRKLVSSVLPRGESISGLPIITCLLKRSTHLPSYGASHLESTGDGIGAAVGGLWKKLARGLDRELEELLVISRISPVAPIEHNEDPVSSVNKPKQRPEHTRSRGERHRSPYPTQSCDWRPNGVDRTLSGRVSGLLKRQIAPYPDVTGVTGAFSVLGRHLRAHSLPGTGQAFVIALDPRALEVSSKPA